MEVVERKSDRVLYTSTVGDIKECNGVSIVFCDEICDYTFIPYDGKLKNIAEYRNNRRSFSNSQIYTMNYKKRGWDSVPCNILHSKNLIYIEKRNFDMYWRFIYNGIRNAAKNNGIYISRNDINKKVDMVMLQNPLMDVRINKDYQLEFIKKQQSIEVQRMYSKKADAMNDKKIHYVYSKLGYLVHDKTCEDAWKIDPWDFGASETLVKDKKMCRKCKKIMLIRSAIGDDMNRINLYMRMFKRGNAKNMDVSRLIEIYSAKLYMESLDVMRIKCKEDTWKVHMDNDGVCKLYHNNYYMINAKERCITSGFHIQNCEQKDFVGVLEYIVKYSWEKHLRGVERKEKLNNLNNTNSIMSKECKKTNIFIRIIKALKKFIGV